MAKETKIELEIPQGRQSFPMEQADGILRMRFNGGWHLPADSEWTWSAEKGFEKKDRKSQPKSAGSKGDNPGSTAENGGEVHDNA